MTRILRNYTESEQSDIEALTSLVPLTDLIDATFQDRYPDLFKRIKKARPNEEAQIFLDMADYIRDEAEFPKHLYYLKFDFGGINDYLNYLCFIDQNTVGDKTEDKNHKTKFTMEEIKAIDENYVPFAVPVDEVNTDE